MPNQSQDGTQVGKYLHSRNQMIQQNPGTCTIEAKIATIKGMCLAWGKDKIG